MRIYLVSSGAYSDYEIVGVYSTKENAEIAIGTMKRRSIYRDYEIEEYELDASIDRFARGELCYNVAMYRDGSTMFANASSVGDDETALNTTHATPYLRVRRWATSAEAVVKIANEIRAQMIASGEWPA